MKMKDIQKKRDRFKIESKRQIKKNFNFHNFRLMKIVNTNELLRFSQSQ